MFEKFVDIPLIAVWLLVFVCKAVILDALVAIFVVLVDIFAVLVATVELVVVKALLRAYVLLSTVNTQFGKYDFDIGPIRRLF